MGRDGSGRADGPERAGAAAVTAHPWGHQSRALSSRLVGLPGAGGGFSGSSGDPGSPLHNLLQRKGALPSAGSCCPPRSLHAGPSIAALGDLTELGVLETLQAWRVICANPFGRGCGSGVLSSQSPSALSPQAPLPGTLGLTPPGAHDALGLPDGLPALLQPCTPAASISPFPAPWLGQARVSGYLAGGRLSSQLVQPPILWSGVGHGSQLCKRHVAQLLLGQRTDAHSASRGNTRLRRMPAPCVRPRPRPVSPRSGGA